ncbi:hypothetical protein LXL04_020795 [Taraxacum kok-saghyz]
MESFCRVFRKRNHSPKKCGQCDIMRISKQINKITQLTVHSKRNYWSLGFPKRNHSSNKTVAGASRGYPTSYMGSTSSTPINRKDNVLQIFGTRFEYGYEIREEMSLNLTRESQNAPLRFRNRIEARTESKQ